MHEELTYLSLLILLFQIKELESQLLVERKIARQHVDNKIAQDVERKQQQQQQSLKEESNSYLRSPMSERNLNSTAGRAAAKHSDMAKQMFSDSNSDTYSFNQLMSLAEEKENNPEAAQLPPTTKARRVSLCNGAYQQPANSASRRSSLIPLPRRNSLIPLPISGKPAAAAAAAAATPLEKIREYSSPPLPCSPPVMSNDKGSRSKRINSILRRSLQKKVVIRPPVTTQAGRRGTGAATQGVDSARRPAARRVPLSGGAAPAGAPRTHHNRDKERGWNTGTSFRNF
jgi:kinesin family protein C2/C3